MSLLDKQEVHDICELTALRARKWSGFICKRAKIRHYRDRSTEERRRKKKKKEEEERRRKKMNAKSRFFFFARCVRKLRYYSDVMHLFDWKSAIEHDGGV